MNLRAQSVIFIVVSCNITSQIKELIHVYMLFRCADWQTIGIKIGRFHLWHNLQEKWYNEKSKCVTR